MHLDLWNDAITKCCGDDGKRIENTENLGSRSAHNRIVFFWCLTRITCQYVMGIMIYLNSLQVQSTVMDTETLQSLKANHNLGWLLTTSFAKLISYFKSSTIGYHGTSS